MLIILPKIDNILKSEPTVLRGNPETVDINLYYGFLEDIQSLKQDIIGGLMESHFPYFLALIMPDLEMQVLLLFLKIVS